MAMLFSMVRLDVPTLNATQKLIAKLPNATLSKGLLFEYGKLTVSGKAGYKFNGPPGAYPGKGSLMATEGKDQRYIELLPGQFDVFEQEARRLGLLQTTGPGAGKVGSVSRFFQYIGGLLEAGYTIEPPKDGE